MRGSLGLPFFPPAGLGGSRGGSYPDGCGLQLVGLVGLVKLVGRVGNGVKRLGRDSSGAEHQLLHR